MFQQPLVQSAIFCCLSILAAGCTAQKTNLAQAGDIKVELIKSSPFEIKRVSVIRNPDHVVVSGLVTREHWRALPLNGHVDLTLVGPTQTNVLQQQARLWQRRATRHMWEGRFTIRLEDTLQRNSTVRLKYHTGDHEGTCPQNCQS